MKDQKYIDLLINRFRIKEERISSRKDIEDLKDKSSEIEREISKYLKDNPELRKYNEENLMEARVQWLGESIHKYFENLPPFNGDSSKIPDIPVLPIPFLREKVWPGLIKAGAIPKKDLIPGREYIGSCRNSSKATWDGEKFIYTRLKFGLFFEDDIKHFEDDDEKGTDVFIPIKENDKLKKNFN